MDRCGRAHPHPGHPWAAPHAPAAPAPPHPRLLGGVPALVSVERFATDRKLIWLFTSWLAVAFICSIALWLAEEGVDPAIDEPLDALWWGVVTLTTVGYGDVFPVTPEGRLAAGALMILGITLFAAITATITSQLIADDHATAADPTELLRGLAALHADGVLTDDEYTSKKAEVLERL